MSVNKAILIGRLGRDPETKDVGGQKLCSISLATEETYKDRSGERQKKTEWHRVVAWGKLAEIAEKYLRKGAQVYIEGRIETREWEDKQGQKKSTTQIVADTIRMLGDKPNGAERESPRDTGTERRPAAGRQRQEITDDDIPF